MTEQTQPKTQEEISQWVREQFQNANKFLAEQGILVDSVVAEESRYLPPLVAVWKLKDNKKQGYWVIGGDLPADVVTESAAEDARAAIKHFSLNWQMKASNLRGMESPTEEQERFAQILETKAENLYALASREEFWSNQ
ncbi:hypothetical protein HMF8227_01624 [Saliniradius amylolyticus]|uniref:DUF4826 domain-containing protein n=1 Tax=Saliniradius amylolyticus TaxID=2183582 RepID=A0A2S2E383_9ALTE|nr:DUF4826 family protein [Saliniradius amylolyticus]AWL12098.1 hypothetical protein HMF8227_01624 [Saliniradius amylolyticus]